MEKRVFRTLEFNKILDKISDYAICDGGRRIINEISPYDSIYEIEKSLNEVDEAMRIYIKKGTPPFEGVYDASEAISLVSKNYTLIPMQLLRIASILRAARNFKKYIERKEEDEKFVNLEEILLNVRDLKKIEDKIFNAIISDDEISDRASQALFNIRRSLKEKNNSIKDKLGSLVKNYSGYLQDNLYTIRGERYVIPVKAENRQFVPGLVHDQSSSGATLFIEPMSLVELNNDIKELKLKEQAEIHRILTELSNDLYKEYDSVKINEEIVYTMDYIFAKAKYAYENDCFMPKISKEKHVDIIRGRHPLINKSTVVPLDLYLGKDFTILVLTGPNTGGKTVTLKTLGLIHLMGLSGILIPASEGSTLGFFNDIYADIGDEQSIEQSLSTFSSHMKNIVSIIKNADKNSLVLLDELGAGTDPTEGAALAFSILETLKNRGSFVCATTHYSELKTYALKSEGVINGSVEFDVETLKPTYRLLIGIPGKSNAFEISRRLGISDDIIEIAKESISSHVLEFEDVIQNLQKSSIEAKIYAEEAESLKLEANKLKEKYEEKLAGINNLRENIMENAKDEARKLVADAINESDEILKRMRKLEIEGNSKNALEEEKKRLNEVYSKMESSISKFEDGEVIKDVAMGEEVYHKTLNQNVTILSLPDSKDEVLVQAGIMKVKAKLKDLRRNIKNKQEKKITKREANLRLSSVSNSIDLRGMDSLEASYLTDKYLDDCFLGGLSVVTIIHGKGTGVLRNSITQMLKKHSHVKSFRLGEYGEGGNGVTIVEIKR
ncbi:MAG: endonuclease MutS2 [Oscillospiraceae bacterium]|nr:endonuclease MutS2 [Oscillospiraceae bacterium]